MSRTQSQTQRSSALGLILLIALGAVIVIGVRQLVDNTQPAVQARPVATNVNLHAAAASGDLAALEAAIRGGADIEAPMVDSTGDSLRSGMTPLVIAASEGSVECVRALTKAGAKTESRGADGRTALIYAAGWGDAAKVEALLEAGARVDARANDGWTALMFAAARGEVGSVRALTSNGADVNAANKWRQTPLMAAARTGSVEKVGALLEAGAIASQQDQDGNTALAIAASSEVGVEALEALIRAGSPVNAADRDGVTPLMKAAERGDAEAVRVLLAAGADKSAKDLVNGWTAKDWAMKRDDEKGRGVVAQLE